MKYVRFQGKTRFPLTTYETYSVFDDDTPESLINRECTELAIDNAEKYDNLLNIEQVAEEYRNLVYLAYLQECISYASYDFVSSEEFFFNIEDC